LTCDHDATRATLVAFRASTKGFDVGDDIGPDGRACGTLLYGTCKTCLSTLAIPITEVRASVIASGEIERREPWNERGSETKSESPSPESSGPVPAERLTGIEVSMERSSPAASAAESTQGQRRISAGSTGRRLEDLTEETPEEMARRLIK
jgi:hypothetical protein